MQKNKLALTALTSLFLVHTGTHAWKYPSMPSVKMPTVAKEDALLFAAGAGVVATVGCLVALYKVSKLTTANAALSTKVENLEKKAAEATANFVTYAWIRDFNQRVDSDIKNIQKKLQEKLGEINTALTALQTKSTSATAPLSSTSSAEIGTKKIQDDLASLQALVKTHAQALTTHATKAEMQEATQASLTQLTQIQTSLTTLSGKVSELGIANVKDLQEELKRMHDVIIRLDFTAATKQDLTQFATLQALGDAQKAHQTATEESAQATTEAMQKLRNEFDAHKIAMAQVQKTCGDALTQREATFREIEIRLNATADTTKAANAQEAAKQQAELAQVKQEIAVLKALGEQLKKLEEAQKQSTAAQSKGNTEAIAALQAQITDSLTKAQITVDGKQVGLQATIANLNKCFKELKSQIEGLSSKLEVALKAAQAQTTGSAAK